MTALLFGLACALYLAGGMALTMLTNVPMNEALAAVRVPADAAAAGRSGRITLRNGNSGIPPEPSSAPVCCCSSAPRS